MMSASDILHRDPNKKKFVKHICTITDESSHLYKILKKKEIEVNSWHHQGVKDVGKDLKVVAAAPDGIIEALEIPSASFVLAVQFHPEWHVIDEDGLYLEIFDTLKNHALKYKSNRKK